ncbi:DUF805 domain-containing protein [Shewanella sedimentimangrovi]|uniref:DUF805 domain-containing protein n=1 Tax=Shewanella sedimentimangrovi TaxID=2814293 RepID=A0ABX7QXX5_9GAMM|nr:DUF805 domain-containing protein [Shewanella sedimentimangrovi]QSX36378.1 DUF805 domain-containing protein [Shewanella sedimentimangrovi]
MQYFIGAIVKYADFTGRARRTEYWMFVLFYLIFYVLLAGLDYLLGASWIVNLFALALLLPSLAVGARRLHDTGRSGWWQLLNFIPVIGWIVLLIFMVQDSAETNVYGANPKALA